MNGFPRIETLGGVKRTVYNQYDAIVRPVMDWLAKHGVRFVRDTRVIDMEFAEERGKLSVKSLALEANGKHSGVALDADDLVFFQNGSMTDASSIGTMTSLGSPRPTAEAGGFGKRSRPVGLPSAIPQPSTRRYPSPTGRRSRSPAATRSFSTGWKLSAAMKPARAGSSPSKIRAG
jgi:MCRA family